MTGRKPGSKNRKFSPNTYIVFGDVTTIDINGVYITFSTRHLDKISKIKWFYDKRSGYCFCNTVIDGKRRTQYLHKIITEWYDCFVDHIDGNKLNNTDENLRRCTHQQNMVNRSSKTNKFRGVFKIKGCSTFRARIKANQVQINLGHFKTQEDAARAYNEAAIKYFGEFARLNVIEE